MLKVSHRIQIGLDSWESNDNSRLIGLCARAGMAVPVNSCFLSLTHPDGIKARVGDDISVEIGHNDELEKIFTGQITQLSWALGQVNIHASSSFRNLVQLYLNLYFEQPTAADMVNALASEGEVSTGTVESGLSFSAYTVGDHASVYQHLKYLAIQCGVDLYANQEDQLVFSSAGGGSHDFQYGINILELDAVYSEPGITKVEVLGESPASHGQGADAWSWLTKTDVSGSNGSNEGIVKSLFDPTARTTDNASSMAENYLRYVGSRYAGRLKTLGRADIRLGEQLVLSQMPLPEQEGTYQIVELIHRIQTRRGFTTTLTFAQVPD